MNIKCLSVNHKLGHLRQVVRDVPINIGTAVSTDGNTKLRLDDNNLRFAKVVLVLVNKL